MRKYKTAYSSDLYRTVFRYGWIDRDGILNSIHGDRLASKIKDKPQGKGIGYWRPRLA